MVKASFEHHGLNGKAALLHYEQHSEDIDALLFADDPDVTLACVALAASMYDDAPFLSYIAAGPLENSLIEPSEAILGRVLSESRKTARFRWMLAGVYRHAIAEEARTSVEWALGNMRHDDPLPPR
jgi:hypothetical protein